MGIFDFLKNKGNTNSKNSTVKEEKASKPAVTPTSNLEHLTKSGELPFGWVTRNKEFTEKIRNEYSFFLNTWLASRKSDPKEQYEALKSFIIYLEDLEKLCKEKGECFEFWYYEILTSKDYLQKRKKELESLTKILNGG